MLLISEMPVLFKLILFVICIGAVAAFINGGVDTAKFFSRNRECTDDHPVVKKYKLHGITCTGTSPHVVKREGAGTGIELTYEIDGRKITGVLDDYFVMDDFMAKYIAESGEPVEICVHPDNEKVFCLMDELYRQKKVYDREKSLRFDLDYGTKLKSTVSLISFICFILILLFLYSFLRLD